MWDVARTCRFTPCFAREPVDYVRSILAKRYCNYSGICIELERQNCVPASSTQREAILSNNSKPMLSCNNMHACIEQKKVFSVLDSFIISQQTEQPINFIGI